MTSQLSLTYLEIVVYLDRLRWAWEDRCGQSRGDDSDEQTRDSIQPNWTLAQTLCRARNRHRVAWGMTSALQRIPVRSVYTWLRLRHVTAARLTRQSTFDSQYCKPEQTRIKSHKNTDQSDKNIVHWITVPDFQQARDKILHDFVAKWGHSRLKWCNHCTPDNHSK